MVTFCPAVYSNSMLANRHYCYTQGSAIFFSNSCVISYAPGMWILAPLLPILLTPVVLQQIPCCPCEQQYSSHSVPNKFFLTDVARFRHPHNSSFLAYYSLLHHCEILRVRSHNRYVDLNNGSNRFGNHCSKHTLPPQKRPTVVC